MNDEEREVRAAPRRSAIRVWLAVLIWIYAGVALLFQAWAAGAFFAFVLGVVVYGRRPRAAAPSEDD